MENKLTEKSVKAGYGDTICVTISLPASIVNELEKRRRFDSRSRYILRAVDHYIREEGQEQEAITTGVRGSETSNLESHQTTPTPTPNPANFPNGGFRS